MSQLRVQRGEGGYRKTRDLITLHQGSIRQVAMANASRKRKCRRRSGNGRSSVGSVLYGIHAYHQRNGFTDRRVRAREEWCIGDRRERSIFTRHCSCGTILTAYSGIQYSSGDLTSIEIMLTSGGFGPFRISGRSAAIPDGWFEDSVARSLTSTQRPRSVHVYNVAPEQGFLMKANDRVGHFITRPIVLF